MITSFKYIVKVLNYKKLQSKQLKDNYTKRKYAILTLKCTNSNQQLEIKYLKNKFSKIYKEKGVCRGNSP